MATKPLKVSRSFVAVGHHKTFPNLEPGSSLMVIGRPDEQTGFKDPSLEIALARDVEQSEIGDVRTFKGILKRCAKDNKRVMYITKRLNLVRTLSLDLETAKVLNDLLGDVIEECELRAYLKAIKISKK